MRGTGSSGSSWHPSNADSDPRWQRYKRDNPVSQSRQGNVSQEHIQKTLESAKRQERQAKAAGARKKLAKHLDPNDAKSYDDDTLKAFVHAIRKVDSEEATNYERQLGL